MSILKATLVTTALVLGSATTVFAQDAMMDKAKDMAVDKGVDMAKEKAMGVVGDDKTQYVDPAAKVGKDMLKGSSAKDAVMGAATSGGTSAAQGVSLGGVTDTSLNADEAVTASKVIMKGGSKEDAAMAIAKERGKNKLKDFGSSTVYGATETTAPTTTAPEMSAPAAPAAMAINCPSGTTAQADGTCMITGDYK